MSLFDSVVGKIKSQREEKRYAQAYPKQYYEEKKYERKNAEYLDKAEKEKAKTRELNKPKAIRAVQNYLKSVKAKKVKAGVQHSSTPQGVFAQGQVNYNKEQESVFTRGQRDSPFKKL